MSNGANRRQRAVRAGARMLGAVLALAAGGCVEQADREAKARIFSPEEPPKVVLAAAQPIDAAALGRDQTLAHRVLTMDAGEALERMGPHRFSASAAFEWKYAAKKVALSEKRVVEQAGPLDFYVKTDNDADHGFELLHLGTQAFARRKYHPYRERKRDRGQSIKLRDETYGLLATASAALGERLGLAPDGEETIAGRSARRYLFTLLEEPAVKAARGASLPAVEFPEGGPDSDTRLRLDYQELRAPKSVSGRLWVDAQSGVPLKSELTATVAITPKDGGEALLTLKTGHVLEAIGQVPALAVPETFLPDEDRPNAVAAALERFEIQRPDAGTEAPEKAAEPADDE